MRERRDKCFSAVTAERTAQELLPLLLLLLEMVALMVGSICQGSNIVDRVIHRTHIFEQEGMIV